MKVYAADVDTFPLAQFDPLSTVSHVLNSLQLQNGGLKLKGSSHLYFISFYF